MSKMEILNISNYLVFSLLITVFCQKSQANLCQICFCSTQVDTTISIDCQHSKIVSINTLHFGLTPSVEYNGTLSSLNLSENNITHLPHHIFQSSKYLKIIDLSKNSLREIHTSLFENLIELQILNLSNNKIKAITSTSLNSLHTLDLSYNSIEDLDLQFHESYKSLVNLNLSHNKLNDSMNASLYFLYNLKHLDLSYNNFNLQSNESLNFLSRLVSLNYSHNFISSLSEQSFPESLVELNVGFNFLKVFPTNVKSIQVLNIEYNQINNTQNINEKLCKLRHLNLSGNILKTLPDVVLKDVKTLDLSYNKFDRIPEFLNEKNYPALKTLVFNGNPVERIFFENLNIKTLIMCNMSHVEKINNDSFKNLNHRNENCLNLTITDNNKLKIIEERALEGLNLCYLNLKNNQFTYLSPILSNSGFKAKFGVDLEGNPFHCNCSLQWMLDDFVPWLYSTNQNLLNNLRCMSPSNLQGKRMVHWYKWKEQILCNEVQTYSSRMTAETLEVLSRNNPVIMHMSNGMLVTLVIAVITLLVLVIVGILLAKKVALKKTRVNRRF